MSSWTEFIVYSPKIDLHVDSGPFRFPDKFLVRRWFYLVPPDQDSALRVAETSQVNTRSFFLQIASVFFFSSRLFQNVLILFLFLSVTS